jgi:CRP/FNR family transcriptional regulator, cyclic AMP receptor protein
MAVAPADLAHLPLLSRLGDAVLQGVAAQVHAKRFAPGQMISLAGDPCEAVYWLQQGAVRVRQTSLEGREYVLAYLGPGDCFDLVSALDGGTCLGTVDAVTETYLYVVPCETLRQMVHAHPDLSAAIATYLAGEVRRLSGMLKDLALHSVRARLARFLLTHAEGRQPQYHWTQEAIAASIGTVRDVVGRTLRTFVDEQLIRRERGRLVVVNPQALEDAARE